MEYPYPYPNLPQQLSGTAPPPAPPAPPQAPAYPQARDQNEQRLLNGAKPKRKLTHQCPYEGCGRWLAGPHGVQQHVREAHTGEKPYVCNYCGDGFSRPWSLYRHLSGKHDVHNANPGKGKWNGLERVGVQGPRVRRQRKVDVRQNAAAGVGGMQYGLQQEQYAPAPQQYVPQQQYAPHPMQQQQHAPPPAPAIQTRTTDGFAAHNFDPVKISCVCGPGFENRESFLSHQHEVHAEPNSANCNCMMCLDMYGGEVDAAGVHVNERSAAMLREMTADDLFGGMDKGGMTGHQGVRKRMTPAADTDEGQRQFQYGLKMSVEEFTKNMRPPRPPATKSNGDRLAVDTPQAAAGAPQPQEVESETGATAPMKQHPAKPIEKGPSPLFEDSSGLGDVDMSDWLGWINETFDGVEDFGQFPDMGGV